MKFFSQDCFSFREISLIDILMKNNLPFLKTARQAQVQAENLMFSNASLCKTQLEILQKNQQLILLPKAQL